MSDAIKKEIHELKDVNASTRRLFFKTNNDKLIELLLNEITFLDTCYYKTDSGDIRDQVCLAIDIFENLLKLQRFTEEALSDKDFASMKEFVYQTINRISKKIMEVAKEL